ncbi:DUF4136 domain-containing protein [Larkinella humicola]|uniref:DUF4136 domain-containing protein n=1 Tax=Larkinella humicola TaxID=2607654 RepID=A0A5N1J7V1_9BACT|nr:DUF4136 domain-containing protein [Larkinella humicola]KAA9347041.1 DUF4136 domain-containing protein [Larkinella humicola]
MKRIIAFAVLLLAGGLSSFSYAQGVTTDYDRSVDFSKFKTFAWCTPDIQVGKNPIYSSPLITQNIENTVTDELTKRNITLLPENPDILVGFHTYTEKKTQTVSNGPALTPMFYPFGFRGGWRYMPYGFGNWPYQWNTGFHNVQYTEGMLILDIVDAHSKQLIWRGTIAGAVDNPAHIEKEVSKGIHKIMKEYPVKAV